MTELTDSGYARNDKKIKVYLASGETIAGMINIVGYQRLSDCLQKDTEHYMILYRAQVPGDSGQKTLFVNKDQIVWVEPVEDD